MSRRQQLLKLARTCLGKLIGLLLRLQNEVRELRRQVKELKARLALNSTNSSQPPSTDGLKKPAPRSLRAKSGRQPGGQPGHPGQTLQPVARPDHIVAHALDHCTCELGGGCSLRQQPVLGQETRQVFELPQKSLEVTEHRAEIKCRPVSGARVTAANLLDRLEDFDLQVLAFAIFEEVSFTNNGAERDIRMVKVRQEISGCFRTLHGARVFARIRSYISTCRKQGRNILDELENAVCGKPFIPSAPPAGP